jgi:AcrR family transcriptional regulator
VSLWLNSGVPATEVARRAGHGVAVLLKIYAHWIDGQATAANQRIADTPGIQDAEETSGTRATATTSRHLEMAGLPVNSQTDISAKLLKQSSVARRRCVACQDETGRLVAGYSLAMVSRQPDESRRSERARQAIHAATAELLASTSYDAITIEKIAAQAGVGKQTIYRWWPSKAAIIVDVWAEVIAPRVAFPDTGDLEADLRAQLTRMLDVLAEPVLGLNYMAVIADSQRDERLAADLSARIFAPRIADTKDRLRSAQAAGQMRDDIDVDTVTDLLYGGIFFRSLFRLVPLDRTQPDALVAALIRGIGPLR